MPRHPWLLSKNEEEEAFPTQHLENMSLTSPRGIQEMIQWHPLQTPGCSKCGQIWIGPGYEFQLQDSLENKTKPVPWTKPEFTPLQIFHEGNYRMHWQYQQNKLEHFHNTGFNLRILTN
jgi:hypothetical protein